MSPNTIRDSFGVVPKLSIESHPSFHKSRRHGSLAVVPLSTSAETTTDGVILGRIRISILIISIIIKLINFLLNFKFVLHLNNIISAMDLLPYQLEVNS